jgi:tetratricopeptide (TPR) repeat protein
MLTPMRTPLLRILSTTLRHAPLAATALATAISWPSSAAHGQSRTQPATRPTTVSATTPRLTGALRWADTLRTLIDRATVRGDTTQLNAAAALADRALQAFPNDGLLLHYRGYASYRRAQLLMGIGADDASEQGFKAALELLDRSSDALPLAETAALRASAMGQLMAGSMIAGMRYGSAAGDADEEAQALAPNNPRMLMLQAVSTFYKPSAFGGSESRARTMIQKAITAFDTDTPRAGYPAWGKAEAWAWKGVMAQKAGNTADARAAFERALAIEPEYGWVRSVLLPGLR